MDKRDWRKDLRVLYGDGGGYDWSGGRFLRSDGSYVSDGKDRGSDDDRERRRRIESAISRSFQTSDEKRPDSEAEITLINAIRKAKRVYIIGNGGSAANASHIANDLLNAGIKAYALTDPAILSCQANDFGWYNCFVNQIKVYGEPGDLLVALSGSGKSPNILKACEEAEKKGMTVWRVFGAERGEDMQQAEEAQLGIGHSLMRGLRKQS